MKIQKIQNRLLKSYHFIKNFGKRKKVFSNIGLVNENIRQNRLSEYQKYSKRFETLDYDYSSFRVKGVLK